MTATARLTGIFSPVLTPFNADYTPDPDRFIRHCRCLDMTLDEIRVLLHFKDAPDENCGAVDALLREHIGHVVSRIRELQALESELRSLQQQYSPGHLAGECGILGGLANAALILICSALADGEWISIAMPTKAINAKWKRNEWRLIMVNSY